LSGMWEELSIEFAFALMQSIEYRVSEIGNSEFQFLRKFVCSANKNNNLSRPSLNRRMVSRSAVIVQKCAAKRCGIIWLFCSMWQHYQLPNHLSQIQQHNPFMTTDVIICSKTSTGNKCAKIRYFPITKTTPEK
jgi:hypothetical protein